MKSPSAARTPASSAGSAQNKHIERRARIDGAEARERLLQAALRLFAAQGYAKASTREIAASADVNVASIRYYFGDKAGLYRAVFTEPLGSARDDIPLYDRDDFTLEQSLHEFFASFLEPLKRGDLVQLCMRLHFREMLEPTGVWEEEIDDGIKPAHAALVNVLCRHLDLNQPDDDVHRVAFAIAGLAVHLFVGRDVIAAIQPRMLADAKAVDAWVERLVSYAMAMVACELQRRRDTSGK